jgi:hypothetical protein
MVILTGEVDFHLTFAAVKVTDLLKNEIRIFFIAFKKLNHIIRGVFIR